MANLPTLRGFSRRSQHHAVEKTVEYGRSTINCSIPVLSNYVNDPRRVSEVFVTVNKLCQISIP